jgi:DNA-binding transcriptional MerR regulator
MRIGQAAEAAGMTTKTLRFYEERGLLPSPGRAANGYRDYGDASVERLGFIRRARTAGLSLAQIGQILAVRDHGDAPCAHVADLLAAQLAALDAQIAELRTLRETVAESHRTAAAGDPSACDPHNVCSYL